MAEWKELNESRQAAALPPVPDPVEAMLRQVWGVAWKEAQGQLETERAALAKLREEIAKERAEMLAEIGRLDGELEAARETLRGRDEALETERHAHEQTRSDAREARALAEERAKRIDALEAEREQERQGRAQAEAALSALRVEAASAADRAALIDEFRALVRSLQEGKGGAEG
jgi:chromosome segregation ATPase